MLSYFRVNGFRGFENDMVFDLAKTAGYRFHEEQIENGIIQRGLLFGRNGSGKSNVGHAIFDIARIASPNAPVPPSFAFSYTYGGRKEPVEFEYRFLFDKDVIRYLYKKSNPVYVFDERLFLNGKPIIVQKDGKSVLNENPWLPSFNLRIGEGNSLLFALFSIIDMDKENPFFRLREFIKGMLFFRSLNRGNENFGVESRRDLVEDSIISRGKTKDLEAFLRGYAGIDLDLEESQGPSIDQYLGRRPKFFSCRFGKQSIPFSCLASSGTLSLLLFYYWSLEFTKHSFIYIDEFDAFYHHELSSNLLKLVTSLKGPQIFLTTHNTSLMTNELMRPDTLFIIAGGKVKPLYECTEAELREGHNLEKIYRAGGFDEK